MKEQFLAVVVLHPDKAEAQVLFSVQQEPLE